MFIFNYWPKGDNDHLWDTLKRHLKSSYLSTVSVKYSTIFKSIRGYNTSHFPHLNLHTPSQTSWTPAARHRIQCWGFVLLVLVSPLFLLGPVFRSELVCWSTCMSLLCMSTFTCMNKTRKLKTLENVFNLSPNNWTHMESSHFRPGKRRISAVSLFGHEWLNAVKQHMIEPLKHQN